MPKTYYFICDYEDSYDDGSVWRGTIEHKFVGTEEEADAEYKGLRQQGYFNIEMFCPEDEYDASPGDPDEYAEADAWCDAFEASRDEYFDYEHPNVDWGN